MPPTIPVEVRFLPGVYTVTNMVHLDLLDSGRQDADVTYCADVPGTVTLAGGIPLGERDFKPVTDKEILNRLSENARSHVLACDLAGKPGTPIPAESRRFGAVTWLYGDGAPKMLARWPNLDDPAFTGGWYAITNLIDKGAPRHFSRTSGRTARSAQKSIP